MVNLKVHFNTSSSSNIEYNPFLFLSIKLPYVPRLNEVVLVSEETMNEFQKNLIDNRKELLEFFPKWFLNCFGDDTYTDSLMDKLDLHEAVRVVDVIYSEGKDEVSIVLDK
jgi:hypothetical protein